MATQNIFVTGGAGYVGSHFALAARLAGHKVSIFDNLSTGHKEACLDHHFIQGDLQDLNAISHAIAITKPDVVVHFAARSLVSESIEKPALYEANNVGGTTNLLTAMGQHHIDHLVFSSSCAVYGSAKIEKIDEDHPRQPLNPYGHTKLQCEKLALAWQTKKTNRTVSLLRYFNVIGSDPKGRLRERHEPETHVVPNLLTAIKEKRPFTIFGRDYSTPDGTCVRDYIDVMDLAHAHLMAVEAQKTHKTLISNVGVGRGYSVLQLIDQCEQALGLRPTISWQPRRPGDATSLISDTRFFRSWFHGPMKTLNESLHTLKWQI